MRRDQMHLILFTRDDLNALKMDAADLPGQRSGAQERYRRAFADGFGAALMRLCR